MRVQLGVLAALRRDTWVDHVSRFLSVFGVAMPVFWLSLIAIYFLFYRWGLVAAPIGRFNPRMSPPDQITGLYVIDSILTGNWVRGADVTLGGELFKVFDFDPFGDAGPVAQIRIDADMGVVLL